jgi:SAM-dependent methyltransferase
MIAGTPPALGVARRVRSQFRILRDGQDDQVIRVPSDAITELIRELTATVQVSVHQIVPFPPRESATESYSDLLWRDPARRGLFVCRLYLLPPGDLDSRLIERRLAEDRADGMDVRCLPVGDVLGDFSHGTPSNIWMIDEKTVVRERPSAFDAPAWTVSARAEDLKWAYDLWDALWGHATPEPNVSDISDLKDPLVISADWVAKLAPMSCTTDVVDSTGCAWYHGTWQYLRLFGLASNPGWHDQFYRLHLPAAVKKALRSRDTVRLLISGTADYLLLAYVLKAVDGLEARERVSINVMNMCPTPLMACRWYAKQRGVKVAVDEMSILKAPDEMNGEFDVITADAFLTKFSLEDSEQVVATWARLLRPGGRVVTTVRIHPMDSPCIRSTEDEVSAFVARARKRAARWLWCLDAKLDELTSSARRYALRIHSTDLGDVDRIEGAFTSNGFDVTHILEPVPGELRPTKYAQIVATKRE